MNRLRSVFLVSVLALSVVTFGCSKSGSNDDALANDIKAKLYSDPTTKTANVNVAVKGGVATLTGDVPSSDVELQAYKLANATAGVTKVADQITVNGQSASASGQNQTAQNLASPAATPAPAAAPPSYPAPAPVAAPPAVRSQSTEVTDPRPPRAERRADAPAPRPEDVDLTIPAGQQISVRTIDAIDSGKSTTGQSFRASLASPLVSQGRNVVPAGADMTLTLVDAKGAGRIKGNSELSIRLSQLVFQGKTYDLVSSTVSEAGKGRGKQTAVRSGIGAGVGAIIGAIAGGGKGAAIGSVVGGGGAAGYQLATHGQQVKIPSETVLTFSLEQPVTIQKRLRNSDQRSSDQ